MARDVGKMLNLLAVVGVVGLMGGSLPEGRRSAGGRPAAVAAVAEHGRSFGAGRRPGLGHGGGGKGRARLCPDETRKRAGYHGQGDRLWVSYRRGRLPRRKGRLAPGLPGGTGGSKRFEPVVGSVLPQRIVLAEDSATTSSPQSRISFLMVSCIAVVYRRRRVRRCGLIDFASLRKRRNP